jgi:xylulokinase
MKTDLVIGVDCSTTSCKAVVWNPDGKKVAEGRSRLEILAPKPLWHEQSSDTWWQGTANALQDALRHINPNRLAAICIAHQRETFVPVDENGVPLRNAILWMDERAGGQLDFLDEVFGKEQFHRLTGKPLSGNLSVVKIAWLQKNEAEVYRKTFKFLDVHAFLVYHLTSKYSTGWGCADPMGLFDMTQDQWAIELLQSVDLSPEQFPDAFPPGQIIGKITLNAARECGLPVGLPVVAGIGDGQSAGLGAKVTNSETAYLNLGTSIVSGYFSSNFQVSDKFRTMYGGVENTYLFETVILGGAYTISWLLEKVLCTRIRDSGGDQLAEHSLESEARKVPAGAQGLLLIPYWNSAMNPYWDTKASGVMVGLRGIHGIGHVYRAILEGIAFEQRLHTSGVELELGSQVENFVVVGGGANSDLWCQIIADVTGKSVQRAREREATALGAGILATSASGIYSDPREAAQAMVHLEDEVFMPDEKRNQLYSRVFEDVYRHIYPALRERLSILADC